VYFGASVGPNGLGNFAVASSDDSGATWSYWDTPDSRETDPSGNGNLVALATYPQFAFGGTGARATAYEAYTLVDNNGTQTLGPPMRGRLGVAVFAQKQSWEDLPIPIGTLAADATGAALLIDQNEILRRTGRGNWESICLPDPAGPGVALTVDDAGAWYVARNGTDGKVRVSRHDPGGSWATETVATGTAQSIAHGVGTVHIAYLRGGNLYYARRVGSAWVEHLVASYSQPPAYGQIRHAYLTIDNCGAPIFAIYAYSAAGEYSSYYTRWTPAGWSERQYYLTSSYGPQLAGGIAVTASHGIIALWAGAWQAQVTALY
jgi:hypothetical protein